ncbi:4-nitrophenyl phosphatase [Alkalibacillus filiformis]|uniref:4-nitrophenyl phosphatase n=1 Tax=Alkalibacillus filiformis TaxID=200990 RepID=A0ABU0DWI2_9BACI|nr:TIGR01457 family HAD-type hydrolase [Alkalibacillus filiformis]MDQ0352822.1 4-nitrophenyl phosphatase [Alkalibacillus filiformis]
MKQYKAYFIDLDGTVYRGKDHIPEAKAFIESLKAKGIPHLFVTNNSSRTQKKTVEKLKEHGIEAKEEQVLTPSIAAANYINQQQKNADVFMIGEEGVKDALENKGITITDYEPDYVVVGIDRHNSYQKIKEACLMIQNGAQFVATNPDIRVPTEEGFVPGNGAYVNLIKQVTQKEPIILGKPERLMIDVALNEIGVKPEEAVMVGDNYNTDIRAGINAGLDTLHVQTGVTSKEDLKEVDIQPTYTVETLAEWEV